MNIHFHYPKSTQPTVGRTCSNPVAPAPTDKRDGVDDADGPGAGGGYDSYDGKPGDADGPGAGGGYDDGVPSGDGPSDADGPGAGGGYDSIFWKNFPPKTSTAMNLWETPAPLALNEYFVAGAERALAKTRVFVPAWFMNNADTISYTVNGIEVLGKKNTK